MENIHSDLLNLSIEQTSAGRLPGGLVKEIEDARLLAKNIFLSITGTALNNLGNLFHSQGRLHTAEPARDWSDPGSRAPARGSAGHDATAPHGEREVSAVAIFPDRAAERRPRRRRYKC